MAVISVRVRRGPFSGIAADGARVNIVLGVYQADHDANTRTFSDADRRTSGTVTVDLRDYPEIGAFPEAIGGISQVELVQSEKECFLAREKGRDPCQRVLFPISIEKQVASRRGR